MKHERTCGILLHITSLAGREGSGTMGKEAYEFADFLKKAGQTHWQILPTNPVFAHTGFSPYDSPSTFAGNHLFISIEKCAEKGWIDRAVIDQAGFDQSSQTVDFIVREKFVISSLRVAFAAFESSAKKEDLAAFEHFCSEESWWLEDYSLYMAIVSCFNTYAWKTWPEDIASRKYSALAKYSHECRSEIRFQKFIQFVFDSQWRDLKKYCNNNGIKLIGDIPIYVNFDSADAWANREIFLLDETGMPAEVSGVPPDYFSKTGQLWGNPLYNWFGEGKSLNEKTMRWWIHRLRRTNSLCDVVRIDHFRAFESFWAVPVKEKTAVNGKWKKGPGIDFFNQVKANLGVLPLIAEDLGIITPEVETLRYNTGLPGMKILQFAFDGNARNSYLGHNLPTINCVVYTGTHDNDTLAGFFSQASDSQKRLVKRFVNYCDDRASVWKVIEYAYATVALFVIIPMQDLLVLGSETRMNTPGTLSGNWMWKIIPESISDELALSLKQLADLYNRHPLNSDVENLMNRF
jgi:4-alpha-glucanotransferase